MKVKKFFCIKKKEKKKNNKKQKKKYSQILMLILCCVAGISLIISGTVMMTKYFRASTDNSVSDNGNSKPPKPDSTELPKTDLKKLTSLMKVTLIFGDNEEYLDGKKLVSLLKKNSKGVYVVSDKKVREYVTKISEKYSTFKDCYTFTTSYGEKVDLLNHGYGWIFDNDYAVEQLTNIINEQESGEYDLTSDNEESKKWWLRRIGPYSIEPDLGNTYAEVSIDKQCMWMYKDGKLVLSSDVVTGNPNYGNDTPKGLYRVYTMSENAELYGPGYETTVAYWMAFNDDIGFHDANWQDEFGGDRYFTNGSHGCVNLPLSTAEKLYGVISVDTPVYVY